MFVSCLRRWHFLEFCDCAVIRECYCRKDDQHLRLHVYLACDPRTAIGLILGFSNEGTDAGHREKVWVHRSVGTVCARSWHSACSQRAIIITLKQLFHLWKKFTKLSSNHDSAGGALLRTPFPWDAPQGGMEWLKERKGKEKMDTADVWTTSYNHIFSLFIFGNTKCIYIHI